MDLRLKMIDNFLYFAVFLRVFYYFYPAKTLYTIK